MYDLSRIRNNGTVCYIDTSRGRELGPVTQALIELSPLLGFNRIIHETREDVQRRIMIGAAIFGPPVFHADGSASYLTEVDVLSHTGFTTDAIEFTPESFNKRMLDAANREGAERVLRQAMRTSANAGSLEALAWIVTDHAQRSRSVGWDDFLQVWTAAEIRSELITFQLTTVKDALAHFALKAGVQL